MSDETSLNIQLFLNFPMTVEAEPNLEGIYTKVPLRAQEPKIGGTNILSALDTPAEPAPQGAGSSSTAPRLTFVAPSRVIEKDMRPMKDVMLASQQIVISILDSLEARMTQLECNSSISELMHLKAKLNETKAIVQELQDRGLLVDDIGVEQLAADIRISIINLLASPFRDPTPPHDPCKI
ncbi:hypothetical protein HAX54_012464 [Datura stramonium]|uniref:Uncharacterized protein n=1 Tax=Datura stramonium TaxID=4076 RepID=A0ABS8TLP4_DATST|nr:hypothetical protein [Datura stramonium]